MAGKQGNGNKTTKSKPGFNDFQFADIRLSETDKKAFLKWYEENSGDLYIHIAEMVNDGCKLSASWSDANDCYIASFTCLNDKSENYCLVLSSRSDDLFEAIAINIYKHRVMVGDSNPWPTSKTTQVWG